MTDAFTLPFIIALIGIALTCILSSALCKEDNRYFWKRSGKDTAGEFRWRGI